MFHKAYADELVPIRFRIDKFSETRIVGKVAKIRVVARLVTIRRVALDGFREALERILLVARKAFQNAHSIPCVIGFWRLLQDLFQVLTRLHELTQVHERDSEVVVLLGSFEYIVAAGQLLVACAHVNLGAIRQFTLSAIDYFLKCGLGAFEFVLLQKLQALLVVINSLLITRIFYRRWALRHLLAGLG